ncbi:MULTISPECIES: hypothetical protein [unclassified Nonomuraea]|uniref:hypothetical protein n=1 Tax=unclassified Nonomuraea TaxID=2593643 RepID=UPI00340A43EF
MSKLLGSKADRDELTAALRDSETVHSEDDPRHEASQKRIRDAEAKLPMLGRIVARDRSL